MKKVLSQEEIDALLASISAPEAVAETPITMTAAGPIRTKPVQVYDFKHPERINKEQLRTLRTIHDNFARMLATSLSTSLRSMVDVDFSSIDQVTFNEYTLSLAVPNALYMLDLEKLDGKAIMEISPQLILHMVDRLLGGTGETDNIAREITIIEQKVVEPLIKTFIERLNEAWSQVHEIGAKLEGFETDPQFVQITRSTEALAIIFFDIRIRGLTYMLNLGLPYYVLEPMLANLSAQAVLASTGRQPDDTRAELIRDRLRASNLSIKVVLAETTVRIGDFIELHVDDLLQVEKRTNAPILIYVGGKPKYLGSPGKLGRKRAVKVLRPITREEELIYD